MGLLVLAACGYELHDDYSSDGCPGDRGCTIEGDAATMTTTMSAVETTTTTGALEPASTGCEFLCEDDAPGPWECDLFMQDCPEGQKCAAYDSDGDNVWDATQCVEITGDGQHGEPCTSEGSASGEDDCAEGVMCWDVDGRGDGTCVALCTGSFIDPICEPPNTTCYLTATGFIDLCVSICNPLLQDCASPWMCIPDHNPEHDGFICVHDASGGMAPEGTPCESKYMCNPGLMCADEESYPGPACEGADRCCAPFCDLMDINACDGLSVADAVCVPFFEPGEAPPEYANVGVCGVAP